MHLDAVGREFLFDELLQLHGRGRRAAEGRRVAGALLGDADADDGGFVRLRGGGRQREDGGDQQRSQQTQWKHGSIEVETLGERNRARARRVILDDAPGADKQRFELCLSR
ncbi:hypothetical protein ACRS8P_14295 [Burkholderia cenocepacia]